MATMQGNYEGNYGQLWTQGRLLWTDRFRPDQLFGEIHAETGRGDLSGTRHASTPDHELHFGGQLWARWQLWTSGGRCASLLLVCPRTRRLTVHMSSREVVYVVIYGTAKESDEHVGRAGRIFRGHLCRKWS